MEDRNRLPPDGGGNPKLSGSAHQSEQNAEVRQEVREQVDLTSAHAKIRKEEISDVPRKVPRFQYVDFPSLHQCIQQLSVPPLDGWLASCQLGKAPGHSPASPKEKVPKFKYVDYPSLHRCIQQLSVPPLESWSSSLLRARAEGGSTDSAKPSLSDSLRMNQGSGTRSQGKRERSPSPERPLPWQHPGKSNPATSSGSLPSNSSSHCEEKDRHFRSSKYVYLTKGGIDSHKVVDLDSASQKPFGSMSECARVEPDRAAGREWRDSRPSVISVVHRHREQHWVKSEDRAKYHCSPDLAQTVRKTMPELVCPFCQKIFSDPVELNAHQQSHKDKRLH